jgi:hypothetical protein
MQAANAQALKVVNEVKSAVEKMPDANLKAKLKKLISF